ncbi:MAG: hypothetical protein NTW28_23480 [Candidatus Solibacter sp.]|nr:hypothetical protein [Candidatus Solibacter sp.]
MSMAISPAAPGEAETGNAGEQPDQGIAGRNSSADDEKERDPPCAFFYLGLGPSAWLEAKARKWRGSGGAALGKWDIITLPLKTAKKKLITQGEAAEELGVSRRQVKRLLKAIKKRSDKAVIHGLLCKPS